MAKKKCIGYKCTILKVVIANRQMYCRFFFYRFLSHVLQRLSIAMIRFGARVRIYFWYLRGGRLFERGRIFIS